MFRLGVGHPDPVNHPNYSLHHPKFNPEEGAIAVGVVTLAQSAYQYWS